MQIVFNRPSILVAVFALLFGGVFNPSLAGAQDTEYHYIWDISHLDPPVPNPFARFQYNHSAAGEIIEFETSYNETEEVLSFDLTLGDAIAPAELPKLFSVTLRPSAESGASTRIGWQDRARYATLYFDVTSSSTPRLSVYSYSANEQLPDAQCGGPNCADFHDLSFVGLKQVDGTYSSPDQICTTEGPGNNCGDWVISTSFSNNGDGTASYSFEVSTAAIEAFSPTNPNPLGQNWDGMRFNWELGYIISFLGYPNMQTEYDANGFLQTVDLGHVSGIPSLCAEGPNKSCPAGYQTLIFGKEFQTAQPLYCEDVTSSPSPINVGDQFTASATAVSRTGQGLEITYLGAPAGSTLDPEDGHVEPADPLNNPPFGEDGYDIFDKEEPIPTVLTAGVSYTPTADDLGKSFDIEMIFRDTFSNFEVICPVNFSVEDPPVCTESNIFSLQMLLDSQAHLQRRQVRRITQRFFRLAQGTPHLQRARRTRRNLRKQANELYDLSWEYIWVNVPSTIIQCDDNPFCVQVSTADKVVGYVENAEQFVTLARRANRRMRRFLGRGAPRIMNRARDFRDIALNEVNNFPTSFSTCNLEDLD